jgi:hypothetical protein
MYDRMPLQPAYVLGRAFIRTHILWEYECYSIQDDPNIQSIAVVDKSLFQAVQQAKPVSLRIGQGAPVRFHPAEDIIYLNVNSLFCLSHIANEARYNPALSWSGFDKIRYLATSLKWPRYHGFRSMRVGTRGILAGLINDGRITFRDYSIPNDDFWVWQVNQGVCRKLRRLQLLSTRPSERQRTVIREERERLLGLIREFFSLP